MFETTISGAFDAVALAGATGLEWILRTGNWNDGGIWDDTATWTDKTAPWIMLGGLWNDAGSWDDTSNWKDAA